MKKIIRIFLSSFLLFAWVEAHALTVADIKTEIRRAILDDPDDTDRRLYTDTKLLDYINEAQREVVNLTWLGAQTTQYILTPQTTYYPLPDDMLAITQVEFFDINNTVYELEEKRLRSLTERQPGWENDVGKPVHYVVTPSSQPMGNVSSPLFISYLPIPTIESTGTVRIWYTTQIPDLSFDSDVPFDNRRNLYSYHMIIVYHAVTRILSREMELDKLQIYALFYKDAVNTMQNRLGQAPNYNPSFGVATK